MKNFNSFKIENKIFKCYKSDSQIKNIKLHNFIQEQTFLKDLYFMLVNILRKVLIIQQSEDSSIV